MIPYCAIVIFFAFEYTYSSYMINEILRLEVGSEPPLDHQERVWCSACWWR